MVHEQKVRKIITLCESFGDTTSFSHSNPDATLYFPPGNSKYEQPLQVGPYLIKHVSQESTEFTTVRQLRVTRVSRMKGGEEHKDSLSDRLPDTFDVEHVHFKGWEDYSVPKHHSLDEFIDTTVKAAGEMEEI